MKVLHSHDARRGQRGIYHEGRNRSWFVVPVLELLLALVLSGAVLVLVLGLIDNPSTEYEYRSAKYEYEYEYEYERGCSVSAKRGHLFAGPATLNQNT